MVLEAGLRASPEPRADRFVDDARAHRSPRPAGDDAAARAIDRQMTAPGKSVERAAQAKSLIRKRLPELGISAHETISLSHSIQGYVGLSRSHGPGR